MNINNEGMKTILDLMEELKIGASLKQEETKKRMIKYYNSKVKERNYKLGDLVLLKEDTAATQSFSTGKLDPLWKGPYVIKQAIGKRAYRLQTHT